MHMSTGDRLKSAGIMSATGMIGVVVGAALVTRLGASERRVPGTLPTAEDGKREQRNEPAPGPLREMQRRLRKLEEQSAKEVDDSRTAQARADHSGNDTPPPPRLTMEQSRERSQRLAREHSSLFEREAFDPTWAHEAKTSLQADLDALVPLVKGTSATVECRTSSCKGTVRWPSYREADDSLMTILTARYERNCAITVTIPPPDNVNAPYDGNIFFDCTEDRAQ